MKNSLGQKLLTTSITTLLALGFSAAAQATTPSPWIETEIAGSAEGCEPQTVGSSYWDGIAQIDTPSYIVNLESDDRYARSNCHATVDIEVPNGWTYAVEKASVSLWAWVGHGVNTTTSLSMYFQGQSETATTKTEINHRYDGDLSVELVPETLNYAPCDASRALNINSSVFARKADAYSYGSAKLMLGSGVKLKLKWKRCH